MYSYIFYNIYYKRLNSMLCALQVLLKFIPDVYINTDQCRGPNAGKSPGFGASLVAETNEKTFYCAEAVSIIIILYDVTE